MAFLATWNLRAIPASAIRKAVDHLESVAAVDSYGSTPEELTRTAIAIQTVVDWVLITNALADAPARAVADELADALRAGSVSVKAANIAAQFWFGTVLAAAGLRPAVPPPPGARPDFVLQGAAYPFGVEVKRPEFLGSVMRNVKRAAGQLRDYGRPGFVVLDLSRAMDVDSLVMALYHSPMLPRDVFRSTFYAVARSISDRVRGYRCDGKFSRVCGLFAYARLHAWHKSDPTSPDMTVFVEAPLFECAASGLLLEQAAAVKTALRSAVGEMTFGNVHDIL